MLLYVKFLSIEIIINKKYFFVAFYFFHANEISLKLSPDKKMSARVNAIKIKRIILAFLSIDCDFKFLRSSLHQIHRLPLFSVLLSVNDGASKKKWKKHLYALSTVPLYWRSRLWASTRHWKFIHIYCASCARLQKRKNRHEVWASALFLFSIASNCCWSKLMYSALGRVEPVRSL
jgi:hypothetical protein